MSDVSQLGEYQLRNLIRNHVSFLLLDLRTAEERAHGPTDPGLLDGAVACEPSMVTTVAAEKAPTKEYPIVLICEKGDTSLTVARELENNGFHNVYVLRGGIGSLDG